jgi:glycosyltransferase involved in cell wall biosynthesis
MRILCCCLRASLLTGSEVYFYELCSTLSLLGHHVTLAATEVSDYFLEKVKGKFNLIDIKNLTQSDFDLVLLSHYETTFDYIKRLMPNVKIVNIIHSEIYDSEKPLLSDNVVKYIGIRPPICEKIEKFGIDKSKIQMIRNPIDLNRFNMIDASDENFGLFVGTMGGLRFKAALHFSEFCRANSLKSVYVSAEDQKLPFFDENHGPTENIERLFKACTWSGGIIHGRTFFEARLCGKKTIEYIVDGYGTITETQYEDSPTFSELTNLRNEFDKFKVAERIIEV